MLPAAVTPGQIWRHDQSGRNYLVTRTYEQDFDQYAMLRLAAGNAPTADPLRIQVTMSSDGCSLLGFTLVA